LRDLVYRKDEMPVQDPKFAPDSSVDTPASEQPSTGRRSWILSLTSLMFILLQSACTAVMAISGIRVIIGVSALAAAAGVQHTIGRIHADAIRIPMMVVAVAGSLINLYVVWRIRSLRARPSSQWRMASVTQKQRRSETFQIVLAIVTLVLVAAEAITHQIFHHAQ
jgi:hypothetical protein